MAKKKSEGEIDDGLPPTEADMLVGQQAPPQEIRQMSAAEQAAPDPQPIDPWAVMNRVAAAMESLVKMQSSAGQDTNVANLITTLTGTMARLAEAQVESGKLIASETRRAHRPSNEVTPGISVFNRRGTNLRAEDEDLGPLKPKLKCIMLIPWLVEWESCTREEVELLNLLEPGDYTMLRVDKSRVRITITVEFKADGKTPSRLLATHDTAFNNDNKALIPPMAEYLRQMLRQHPLDVQRQAAAIMSDEEEEALIESGQIPVSV